LVTDGQAKEKLWSQSRAFGSDLFYSGARAKLFDSDFLFWSQSQVFLALEFFLEMEPSCESLPS